MGKFILFITNWMHMIAQILIVAMMLIITADVLGRSLFGLPIKGTFELTELSLAMVVFFGLASTNLAREHITVDFLVEKLPVRIQLVFKFFINLLIIILLSLIAWQLWENSQRLQAANAVTGDLGIPVYLFLILAAVGVIVFALTALLGLVDSLKRMVNKHES